MANILKVKFGKPNTSDFEETVKILSPKTNLDPYCVQCELETFVTHLISKRPKILSTRKATVFAYQWRELFLLTNKLYQ